MALRKAILHAGMPFVLLSGIAADSPTLYFRVWAPTPGAVAARPRDAADSLAKSVLVPQGRPIDRGKDAPELHISVVRAAVG